MMCIDWFIFICNCNSSSSDKTVKVWDASTRQCVHTFKDHSDQVSKQRGSYTV